MISGQYIQSYGCQVFHAINLYVFKLSYENARGTLVRLKISSKYQLQHGIVINKIMRFEF